MWSGSTSPRGIADQTLGLLAHGGKGVLGHSMRCAPTSMMCVIRRGVLGQHDSMGCARTEFDVLQEVCSDKSPCAPQGVVDSMGERRGRTGQYGVVGQYGQNAQQLPIGFGGISIS